VLGGRCYLSRGGDRCDIVEGLQGWLVEEFFGGWGKGRRGRENYRVKGEIG
jgi:hypothetical protein